MENCIHRTETYAGRYNQKQIGISCYVLLYSLSLFLPLFPAQRDKTAIPKFDNSAIMKGG